MKLRTVTVIVLMLGAVAWCRAQDHENVTQIISHYADSDSAKAITFYGQTDTYKMIKPVKPLTLDSLVVLWDEYVVKNLVSIRCPSCGSDSIYDKGSDKFYVNCYGSAYWERNYYSPSALTEIRICGNCGTLYSPIKRGKSGFMDFIRRKAGE